MSTLTITVPPDKRYDYDGEVELPFRLVYDLGFCNLEHASCFSDANFVKGEIERIGAPGTKVENVRVVDEVLEQEKSI